MIIEAGYRITVRSCENDGDNYKTEVMDALRKEEAVLAVKLLKLLECEFGNMYEPAFEEQFNFAMAARKVILATPTALEQFDLEYETTEELVEELCSQLHEFLHEYGVTGTEYFTRRVTSIEVHYIPEPIVLEDVTAEFE